MFRRLYPLRMPRIKNRSIAIKPHEYTAPRRLDNLRYNEVPMNEVRRRRVSFPRLFLSVTVLEVPLMIILLVGISSVRAVAGDALYFSFQSDSALPPVPSSVLIQSPSFISVPAGAVLSVHLMRCDTVVTTSNLTFQQGYENTALIPAVPLASFVPLGTSTGPGRPLPAASLVPGEADLTRVAMEPSKYRVLWMLSAGVMGTPGRAVITGAPVSFVDLKLIGVSAASLLGDQKPGSVLFFNRYTSSASNSLREDTTLNLTNTHPALSAFLRLFLINGMTCESQEIDLCLAAQQTIGFQMSDFDPGIKGYIVAIATNQQGEPIQFNWLTGNTIVKQPAADIGGSFTSVLNAIAIARRKAGEVKAGTNNEADLIFDDVNYDRLPLQSAFDGIQSQLNAMNVTTFALYRPLARLGSGTANATIQVTGWGKDETSQVVTSGGTVSTACYGDFSVAQLRFQPISIAQLLPSGSSAWFAVSTSDSQPLLGAQINTGQYNSGSNARAISYASEYRIKVPVSAVSCPQ